MLLGKSARKKEFTTTGITNPLIDVYDIELKKVVFTGTKYQIATFLTSPIQTVNSALKSQGVTKKKYTLRIKKEQE